VCDSFVILLLRIVTQSKTVHPTAAIYASVLRCSKKTVTHFPWRVCEAVVHYRRREAGRSMQQVKATVNSQKPLVTGPSRQKTSILRAPFWFREAVWTSFAIISCFDILAYITNRADFDVALTSSRQSTLLSYRSISGTHCVLHSHPPFRPHFSVFWPTLKNVYHGENQVWSSHKSNITPSLFCVNPIVTCLFVVLVVNLLFFMRFVY